MKTEIDEINAQIEALIAKREKLRSETSIDKERLCEFAYRLRNAADVAYHRQVDWWKRDNSARKEKMLNVFEQDRSDLYDIARRIELGDNPFAVRKAIMDLDTIIRDQIPQDVYDYYTKETQTTFL